jgi:hypothetical protein
MVAVVGLLIIGVAPSLLVRGSGVPEVRAGQSRTLPTPTVPNLRPPYGPLQETGTPSPTPTDTGTPTETPTATPTVTPGLGEISLLVWLDLDGDGQQQPDEPGLPGVAVDLYVAKVFVRRVQTQADGTGHATGLTPGVYVVWENQPPSLRYSSTPNEQALTVEAGKVSEASFGDWNGRATYLPLILAP